MVRKEDIQTLVTNNYRRLQKLKEQQALRGIGAAPELLIEIEDIEKNLVELRTQLAKIEETEAIEKIEATLQKLQTRLRTMEQSAGLPRVPFTDREDKIELILSSFAPSYYLIDAPAGYGKTELLVELKRRFLEKGWVSAYVSADTHNSLQKLVEALFKELDLNEHVTNTDARRLGLELGGLLKQKRRGDITKGGIVFLIDLGKKPSTRLIIELLDEFIPSVQRTLRTDEFFSTKHNRFRVVIAGRYLAGLEQVISTVLPLTILSLSPFVYKHLYDTSREYLENTAEDTIMQISAHIMHITGGHPGCMARLLEIYKDNGCPPCDDFIELYKEDIQKIIEQEIERVRDSIPKELLTIMNRLGIFRCLNYNILDHLIRNEYITEYSNVFALADNLTTNYLLGRSGRLLKNDSTHRLLALSLRHKTDYFNLAQKTCADYLVNPSAHMPEVWAIEYMYQFLQSCSTRIERQIERRQIRKIFLEEKVPAVLQMLTAERNPKEELEALKQALQQDHEFRFLINYYLREDQFDEESFNSLQTQIDQFFAK